jgi:hypothetical protein
MRVCFAAVEPSAGTVVPLGKAGEDLVVYLFLVY